MESRYYKPTVWSILMATVLCAATAAAQGPWQVIVADNHLVRSFDGARVEIVEVDVSPLMGEVMRCYKPGAAQADWDAHWAALDRLHAIADHSGANTLYIPLHAIYSEYGATALSGTTDVITQWRSSMGGDENFVHFGLFDPSNFPATPSAAAAYINTFVSAQSGGKEIYCLLDGAGTSAVTPARVIAMATYVDGIHGTGNRMVKSVRLAEGAGSEWQTLVTSSTAISRNLRLIGISGSVEDLRAKVEGYADAATTANSAFYVSGVTGGFSVADLPAGRDKALRALWESYCMSSGIGLNRVAGTEIEDMFPILADLAECEAIIEAGGTGNDAYAAGLVPPSASISSRCGTFSGVGGWNSYGTPARR